MSHTGHPDPVRAPSAGILRTLKENHAVITASVCLVALVVVMKNVLGVPQAVLERDLVVYSLIYLGFLAMTFSTGETRERPAARFPVLPDVLIVGIALAIVVVYAL